ncbi:hypothetical protein CCMA1212_006937 [Trichoderma ghanense]|uniref:Uncharacterized protein n=1 Tax=Trichoderma ghanense TaxID=65468 RepID=A0ABY2H0W9_9HYPO
MPTKPPPPRFEISDLGMSESDPRYSNAVKCVQMYWTRATHMTEKHCTRYLEFLRPGHVADFIPAKSTKTAASLYEHVPEDYTAAIKKRYVNSTLQQDYTADCRRLYPEPAPGRQQGNVTSTPDQGDEAPTSSSQQEDTTLTEASASPESSTPAQSSVLDAWHIDDVVSMLSLPSNKKRPNPSPRSIAKRVKVGSDEMLEKMHREAEKIQQVIMANQDIKLQELHRAIDENRQALSVMQSELRQFMSAVATTLRDIQEHLDA